MTSKNLISDTIEHNNSMARAGEVRFGNDLWWYYALGFDKPNPGLPGPRNNYTTQSAYPKGSAVL